MARRRVTSVPLACALLFLSWIFVAAAERRGGPLDLDAPRRPRQTARMARWRLRPSVASLLLLAAAPTAALPPGMMMIEEADVSGDGFVDREEYLRFARRLAEEEGAGEASRRGIDNIFRDLWEVCDIDEDGMLKNLEFQLVAFLLATASQGSFRESDGWFGERETSARLSAWDQDESGRIELSEFMSRVREMPHGSEGPIDEEHEAIFAQSDVNGDGGLGPRELQLSMYLLHERAVERTIAYLHSSLDIDGDQRIDRGEVDSLVQRARAELKLKGNEISLAEYVQRRFDEDDEDRDGTLSDNEVRGLAYHLIVHQIRRS